MIHFSLDSNLIHKESDEAQRQLNRQKGEQSTEGDSDEEEEVEEEGEVDEGGKGQEKKKTSIASGGEQQLRNQFNFSERASQTLNNPCRVWTYRL